MIEGNEKQPHNLADTNPFGIPTQGQAPKRRWRKWLLVIPVVAAAVSGYWLLQRTPLPPRPAVKPAPAAKPPTLVTVQLTINEIIAREEIAYRIWQKLAGLLDRYRAAGGTALVGFDLAAPVEVSERILQQAASVEHKPLHTRLLADMRPALTEIGNLRAQITVLEAKLGAARLVRTGETHSRIVLEYLTAVRKLTTEEAAARLPNVPLHEPLLPGNKVWNLWLREGFFSFITQGEAPLPPSEVQRQAQQRQRTEKDAALRLLNSLHYLIDTRAQLIEKGILSSGFLKSTQLDNLDPVRFRHAIDLRETQVIRIAARALGLPRINRVTVFPKEFQVKRDFSLRIAASGKVATLSLLIPDRFRGQRLVIAVE